VAAVAMQTPYTTVAHLASFWRAVFSLTELQAVEGRRAVAALMTDCIITDAVLSHGQEAAFEPRTTALQEQAFQALQAFVGDPGLTRETRTICLEAVWVTACL
jgi:hypothetical protein